MVNLAGQTAPKELRELEQELENVLKEKDAAASGFAHARRPHKDERTNRPFGVFQTSAAAAHRFGHLHHGLILADNPLVQQAFQLKAIKAAVTLSMRYLPDRYLPDKAIDLMDEAAAMVNLAGQTAPSISVFCS